MRKIIIFLLAGVYFCFLSGTVLAEKEANEVEKSTTVEIPKEIPKEKPAGMSDDEWEKLRAKVPLPYDRGPTTIDVSKYPKEMQELYKIFDKKCTECHTIARGINAPHVGEEWKAYLKKMMKKPGAKITPIDAKKIDDFLVYDSKIRKKGEKLVEIVVQGIEPSDIEKCVALVKQLEEVKTVEIKQNTVRIISDLAFTGESDINKLLKKEKIKFVSITKSDLKPEQKQKE